MTRQYINVGRAARFWLWVLLGMLWLLLGVFVGLMPEEAFQRLKLFMRNIISMDVSEMKVVLKETESITFSKHFSEEKVRLRGIAEEEIKRNLTSPLKLIAVEDQADDTKGHKYALLFSKSHKYDLRVIVSLKDKRLNVITAHIQNIKRRKVYEKWLGRRK